MTIADLEHFRNLLLERQQNLVELVEHSGDDLAMDKTRELLGEIKEALDKVEHHEYGVCKVCQDSVELHRLEVQPLTDICLGCVSKEELSQLEDDLYMANRVYRALLPQCAAEIDGFEVAVRSAEARYVGGDYYDFLPPAAGCKIHRIAIADIMGKGIPAGMLMSNVQGGIRLLSETISSPSELVTRLNRWLCRNGPVTKFVSLVCLGVSFDDDGRALVTYANAGHCQPVLLRKSGQVDRLEPTGMVLGVREDCIFGEGQLRLESGDAIYMYTDGIVEAENTSGDQFGDKRVIDFLAPRRSNDLKTLLLDLVTQVKAFTLKPQLADDHVVLAIRRM
jgi:sigma-B regulation protein RsbU (phosphoserine phosphatase)